MIGVPDLRKVEAHYQVPAILQSCHTAIVDGYVVQGHVPVREIRRLLSERPSAVGLVVPGMPIGSPGMEVEGVEPLPYQVFLVGKDGGYEVYATY